MGRELCVPMVCGPDLLDRVGHGGFAECGETCLAVTAMFVLALSWISVALGLLARNPEAAQGFTFFLMFIPFVGSAFVPTDTMPTWLRSFAEHQPVTPVIETLRGLLMGTEIGNSAMLAVIWCVAIGLAGYLWASLIFKHSTAH